MWAGIMAWFCNIFRCLGTFENLSGCPTAIFYIYILQPNLSGKKKKKSEKGVEDGPQEDDFSLKTEQSKTKQTTILPPCRHIQEVMEKF